GRVRDPLCVLARASRARRDRGGDRMARAPADGWPQRARLGCVAAHGSTARGSSLSKLLESRAPGGRSDSPGGRPVRFFSAFSPNPVRTWRTARRILLHMSSHREVSSSVQYCLLLALFGSGCGDERKSMMMMPPMPGTTLTVTGKIVDIKGQPLPFAPVFVTGKSPKTTDGSGNFSFNDVTTPYDVAFIDSTWQYAVVYKGLTRAAPSLVSLYASGPVQTARISGMLSGPGFLPNSPAGYETVVSFQSPEASYGAAGSFGAGAFSFDQVQWRGPTTTRGSMYAIQTMVSATRAPVGYRGYGTYGSIALTHGSSV